MGFSWFIGDLVVFLCNLKHSFLSFQSIMKKYILLLTCVILSCNYTMAHRTPIVVQNGGSIGDHSEYYPPADLPEVYFDDDNLEIIIEADGFASYYYVDIVSQSTQLAVISTQISGYGDTIDVSSLPDDDYTIIITSSNNNVFQGYFTNY